MNYKLLNPQQIVSIEVNLKTQCSYAKYVHRKTYLWGLIKFKSYIMEFGVNKISNVAAYLTENKCYLERGILYQLPYFRKHLPVYR